MPLQPGPSLITWLSAGLTTMEIEEIKKGKKRKVREVVESCRLVSSHLHMEARCSPRTAHAQNDHTHQGGSLRLLTWSKGV